MNNDNKKLIVIGALGLVLVAVGAFTFVGGGGDPAPSPVAKTSPNPTETASGTAKDDSVKELTPEEKLIAQLNSGELPVRDPFAPDIVASVVTPPVQPSTQGSVPRATSSGRRPSGLRGNVPPFNPMGGGIGGGLPPMGGGSVGLEPGTALRSPDDPGYRVKGVIQGRKPMAVLEDGNGNQKLVPVGGSVDGDTQVTGIEKGKVRVRHRGKEKILDLEEGTK